MNKNFALFFIQFSMTKLLFKKYLYYKLITLILMIRSIFFDNDFIPKKRKGVPIGIGNAFSF